MRLIADSKLPFVPNMKALLVLCLFGLFWAAPTSVFAQEGEQPSVEPAAGVEVPEASEETEEAAPSETPTGGEEVAPSEPGEEVAPAPEEPAPSTEEAAPTTVAGEETEEEEFGEIDINEPAAEVEEPTVTAPEEENSKFRPILSAGIGLMTYYGELSKSDFTNDELITNIGYDLKVTFPLRGSYFVSFHVLRGTLSANERSATRNLNFRSTITSGGFEFLYNFDHLIGNDHTFYPSAFIGLHGMEFLSKTDRFDQAGNEYHYWEDGTIRNIPENSELATRSVRLQRDYIYETDIRSQNLDGLGDYNERTWAIPIGLGLNLILNDKVDFRLGTSYFFTLTDQIDGISKSGTGVRQGDNRFDNFLFSTFSLTYNLSGREKMVEGDTDMEDLLAMEKADKDGDGVRDFDDLCPGTPADTEVDSTGCPLDGDHDGVANYRDDELETPDSMFVDTVGVGLTDEALAQFYLRYIDSTGRFAPITDTVYVSQKPSSLIRRQARYSVQVADTGAMATDAADAVIASDVGTLGEGEQEVVAVGEFERIEDALAEQERLREQGVPTEAIVQSTQGKLHHSKDKGIFVGASMAKDLHEVEGVMFRIQLGAFSKKPDLRAYESIGAVIPVPTSDGLTRVYHGEFSDYAAAAAVKEDLINKGFPDVLVKAFATKEFVPKGDSPASKPGYAQVNVSSADASKVRFKVQVGSFSKTIPNDLLKTYIQLGDVSSEKMAGGAVRYFVGSFQTAGEANAFKDQVKASGIADAFLVGEYEGKTISVTDAINIKEEK